MTEERNVDIYRPVGEGGEISGLDMRLLEMAARRMTFEQMSKKLGLESMTPARCGQRVREILRSQDALSRTEQKSLLLLDLVKLRDMIFERLQDGETHVTKDGEVVASDANPAMYGHMVRLLKEWRTTIDSMQEDIDGTDVRIRRAHAQIMMEAISVMFDRFLLHLDRAGYHVPPEVAREIMEEVMPLGFQSLEKRVA